MSIIPFTIIGMIALFTSWTALSTLTFGQLESMREMKKTQIESFFNERQRNMSVLMETVAIFKQAAFEKIFSGVQCTEDDYDELLQYLLEDAGLVSPTSQRPESQFKRAVIEPQSSLGQIKLTQISNMQNIIK